MSPGSRSFEGRHTNAPPGGEASEVRHSVSCATGCGDYPSHGPMISAKLLRARFRRDLTVPRLVCVISAISS